MSILQTVAMATNNRKDKHFELFSSYLLPLASVTYLETRQSCVNDWHKGRVKPRQNSLHVYPRLKRYQNCFLTFKSYDRHSRLFYMTSSGSVSFLETSLLTAKAWGNQSGHALLKSSVTGWILIGFLNQLKLMEVKNQRLDWATYVNTNRSLTISNLYL